MNKIAVIHNIPIHYKHLLFTALAERGVQFTVLFVAAHLRNAAAFNGLENAGRAYPYKIGFDGPYEEAPSATRAAFVWKNLQVLSPSLLIISGYYAVECWTALAWAKLHKTPVILWFESNEFDAQRHWPKETLKRLFLRGCDQAHVYGKSNAAYLEGLGMARSKLLFKRAVVNADLFRTAPQTREYRRGGVFRLLYVGRLAPEKNLELLLRGFASVRSRLPADSLRLAIAGTGPLERQLRQTCAELGIDGAVDFLGYRPQESLPEVCRSSDVLVLPSLVEPWGLVVNEAMFCRTPVIVSRQCGCAADLVTPETGWCFSPQRQSELEAAILGAATSSDETLAAMGDAAYQLALHYTPEKCADRIIEGLSRLGSSQPGGLRCVRESSANKSIADHAERTP